MKRTIFIILLIAGAAVSCVEQRGSFEEITENETYDPSFDFGTITQEEIAFQLNFTSGEPASGVLLKLWTASPSQNGEVVFKGITDSNGSLSSAYNLSNARTSYILEVNYIGLPNYLIVTRDQLTDGILINGYDHDYEVLDPNLIDNVSSVVDGVYVDGSSNGRLEEAVYQALGTFNSNGTPDYLLAERDVISSQMLEFINTSLPEGKPVPTYHPEYLADDAETNLNLTEKADVWMTFVHEGAGYKNVLGFYTYPTNNPPQSKEDVTLINIAFPNASLSGLGGELLPGDKVHLGRFEAGTSIGFALLANGWNGREVTGGLRQVYSHNDFNPETDPVKQQHSVLLYDDENELFLIGLEDLNRMEGSDDDFNDAAFYITSNPVEAIDSTNVKPIDKPVDADGDGVNDTYDEFPNDPKYAYQYSYPGDNSYGTFAFEDQWPGYGDYDFNDMVVDYKFHQLANAQNKLQTLRSEFIIKAVGAGFDNAFGFEMDVTPSAIKSVTGNEINRDLFTFNGNGTEAGTAKAVIVATDDAHASFGMEGFVNTVNTEAFTAPDTIIVDVEFNTPQVLGYGGSAPFNPFIVINQTRGREVHLPGYDPTSNVDASYFGTGNDASDPNTGVYYKSKTGLPWGMNLPVSFDYPEEKKDIRDIYLNFNQWAKSSGFTYMDWYVDQPGYRAVSGFYEK
jgi:LruC domain-containing protein